MDKTKLQFPNPISDNKIQESMREMYDLENFTADYSKELKEKNKKDLDVIEKEKEAQVLERNILIEAKEGEKKVLEAEIVRLEKEYKDRITGVSGFRDATLKEDPIEVQIQKKEDEIRVIEREINEMENNKKEKENDQQVDENAGLTHSGTFTLDPAKMFKKLAEDKNKKEQIESEEGYGGEGENISYLENGKGFASAQLDAQKNEEKNDENAEPVQQGPAKFDYETLFKKPVEEKNEQVKEEESYDSEGSKIASLENGASFGIKQENAQEELESEKAVVMAEVQPEIEEQEISQEESENAKRAEKERLASNVEMTKRELDEARRKYNEMYAQKKKQYADIYDGIYNKVLGASKEKQAAALLVDAELLGCKDKYERKFQKYKEAFMENALFGLEGEKLERERTANNILFGMAVYNGNTQMRAEAIEPEQGWFARKFAQANEFMRRNSKILRNTLIGGLILGIGVFAASKLSDRSLDDLQKKAPAKIVQVEKAPDLSKGDAQIMKDVQEELRKIGKEKDELQKSFKLKDGGGATTAGEQKIVPEKPVTEKQIKEKVKAPVENKKEFDISKSKSNFKNAYERYVTALGQVKNVSTVEDAPYHDVMSASDREMHRIADSVRGSEEYSKYVDNINKTIESKSPETNNFILRNGGYAFQNVLADQKDGRALQMLKDKFERIIENKGGKSHSLTPEDGETLGAWHERAIKKVADFEFGIRLNESR